MARSGVSVVKIDGERPNNLAYTVAISGHKLGDIFLGKMEITSMY